MVGQGWYISRYNNFLLEDRQSGGRDNITFRVYFNFVVTTLKRFNQDFNLNPGIGRDQGFNQSFEISFT